MPYAVITASVLTDNSANFIVEMKQTATEAATSSFQTPESLKNTFIQALVDAGIQVQFQVAI